MPTDNPLARMWGKLTAPEPPPDGTDYERERDERVARNRAIMRELGINNLASTMGLELEGGSKRKRTGARDKPGRSAAARGPAPTSAPTRRSTRSTRHTGSFFDDVDADALRTTFGETRAVTHRDAATPREHAREEDETFDDSGVLRYVAWGSADDGQGPSREPSSLHRPNGETQNQNQNQNKNQNHSSGASSAGRLVGFAELPARFVDGTCKKGFYSVDARRGLLAAGGDGGRCAVFALEPGAGGKTNSMDEQRQTRDGDEKSAPSDGDASETEEADRETDERGRRIRRQSPTLSWTAHRGWCSQAQFPDCTSDLDRDSATNASYLLTAGGMDGTVCSWDLAVKSAATGAPKLTWRLDAGRGSGVFSMHHARDELLVGCKDWTVRRWRVGEGAVRGAVDLDPTACVEYDGLHRGVVRCVRWNDASPGGDAPGGDESDFDASNGVGGKRLFASCGGDGRVAVVDTRIAPSRAKVAGLDDAHGGRPVNFVEWGRRGRGGGNGYSLLTSGGDAFVRLWDLRALATSLDEKTVDETVAETDGDDVPMTLALAYEFTGHHRAGLTRPKSITRAVFVFDGNKKRDGPIEKSSGENDDDDDDHDDDDARVVTPGEQSRAVSLYRRGRGRGFEEATRERPYPRLGECVSRGDVGFDPTAVFSLGAPWNRRGESSSSSSFGWSLALANKGEIRVYEPVREGGGAGAGGASASAGG